MRLNKLASRLIISIGLSLSLLLSLAAIPALAVTQADCNSSNLTLGSGIACGSTDSASNKGLFDNGNLFQAISNTLIIVIGAVSVLMIIIGGLRYVLSAGDPKATAGAKDTILYAVIGVVVAIMAFAILHFVVGQFG